MTFGEFARLKRQRANLSQTDVAAGMGLANKSGVYKLETGLHHWKLDQLFLFAQVLGLRPSQLLAEYENQEGG